ncbi:MAG TPA: YicC/YloC family endoribonuclease [Dissulfurispiraceae bacterium]|nr:YicC/YloC family endoribonuclease [Dissulfurispiraceae bacterium]
MIRSMTGYGSAEKEGFKVEVRSLNHKYNDISVRMPSFLMEHEIAVRKSVRTAFERGKVDVAITLTDKRQKKVKVNTELATEMFKAFELIQKELHLSGSLDISFFAGFRELLLTEESESNAEALFDALKEAISKVEEMRKTEGAALEKELRYRLDIVKQKRDSIAELTKDVVVSYKDKLSKKIADLLQGPPDEIRLAQEIAFIAQKADISEELARLASHIKQFGTFLSADNPVGRRLDFLCQEMNREVNTIASKVDDVEIISLAIDIKSELEKLREQVQNIQ